MLINKTTQSKLCLYMISIVWKREELKGWDNGHLLLRNEYPFE